ncbi:cysteine-rich motor neuron 1 protein-like [Physella acuta]|uniref:cysteine-rich motor neuron 1 protein-like n=1 Tax=Physella acuta TaxID=109671 RepID=UPI0027DBB8C4|nr:cysteine-rich motor neuron 1 protein-like [Physella acuta]
MKTVYAMLFVAVAVLVGSVAAQICTHDGVEYNQGDRVPVDSCNTCICDGPEISCTRMLCPESSSEGCYLNGVLYPSGDPMPSDDCNYCFCAGRLRACTLMGCPPYGNPVNLGQE